jgi:hypothetical protein
MDVQYRRESGFLVDPLIAISVCAFKGAQTEIAHKRPVLRRFGSGMTIT